MARVDAASLRLGINIAQGMIAVPDLGPKQWPYLTAPRRNCFLPRTEEPGVSRLGTDGLHRPQMPSVSRSRNFRLSFLLTPISKSTRRDTSGGGNRKQLIVRTVLSACVNAVNTSGGIPL
jgi:hypothetical protein